MQDSACRVGNKRKQSEARYIHIHTSTADVALVALSSFGVYAQNAATDSQPKDSVRFAVQKISPTNSSLTSGATSLFGIRADLRFGKLSLQTVVSQKTSE